MNTTKNPNLSCFFSEKNPGFDTKLCLAIFMVINTYSSWPLMSSQNDGSVYKKCRHGKVEYHDADNF